MALFSRQPMRYVSRAIVYAPHTRAPSAASLPPPGRRRLPPLGPVAIGAPKIRNPKLHRLDHNPCRRQPRQGPLPHLPSRPTSPHLPPLAGTLISARNINSASTDPCAASLFGSFATTSHTAVRERGIEFPDLCGLFMEIDQCKSL